MLEQRSHLDQPRLGAAAGYWPGDVRGVHDPRPVGLARRAFQPTRSRDIGGIMSFYRPDAVFDLSAGGLGVFQGRMAIQGFMEDWFRPYDRIATDLDEVVQFRSGVTCTVVTQKGRLADGGGEVAVHYAVVNLWVDGLDRAERELHRHRGSPCCRRTSRRGTGVDDDAGERGRGAPGAPPECANPTRTGCSCSACAFRAFALRSAEQSSVCIRHRRSAGCSCDALLGSLLKH